MKKTVLFILAAALCCALAAGIGEAHTVTRREVPVYIRSVDTQLTAPQEICFLDGVDDLPWLRIPEMGELLYFLYTYEGIGDDPDYRLSAEYDGAQVRFTRENGYSCLFDFEKDTISFDDYNAFLQNSNDATLIDLVVEKGTDEQGNPLLFLRDKDASFDRYGDAKIIDLSAYGIHLVAQDGEYYIPLQTANDIFFAPGMMSGFLYNGEALFLAGDAELWDGSQGKYSDLAELYYAGGTGERSEALGDFAYRELCMAMDLIYGLKEPHDIKTFAQTFWEIGYDEPLAGTDAVDADRALMSFINYHLDDLHSSFNEFSCLAGIGPIPPSGGVSNRRFSDHAVTYRAMRELEYPDGCPQYEEVGNTAFVTFDNFNSDFKAMAFYDAAQSGGAMPEDTIGLIIYAHSQITRENSPIQNVVLDLSCNTGGAVDAAIFVLGWMLGDVPFSVKDMSTGAMSTSVYRADVNLDGVYDASDTIQDKNVYCLVSPVSFSCGNLVPAVLKSSQKATLLGKTTGGGSCVVQPMCTASGTVFQTSSSKRISFLKNGSFYDIDQGVEPDIYIDLIANFYNREGLCEYLNTLF